jgi:hypothetical protein
MKLLDTATKVVNTAITFVATTVTVTDIVSWWHGTFTFRDNSFGWLTHVFFWTVFISLILNVVFYLVRLRKPATAEELAAYLAAKELEITQELNIVQTKLRKYRHQWTSNQDPRNVTRAAIYCSNCGCDFLDPTKSGVCPAKGKNETL